MAKQPIQAFKEFYELDKLIEKEVLLPLGPKEITIALFQERTGLGYGAARQTLERLVKEKKLVYLGKRRSKFRAVHAWRII